MTDERPLYNYLDTLYEETVEMEELVMQRDTKAKADSKTWFDRGTVEILLNSPKLPGCCFLSGNSVQLLVVFLGCDYET